jgi:hypothetical protein
MAKPFIDLLKKELSFHWGEDQHKVFKDLKNKLSSLRVLKFLYFTKPFDIHANANDFIIGGVFL